MHARDTIVHPVPGDQAADQQQHDAQRIQKDTQVVVGPRLYLDR